MALLRATRMTRLEHGLGWACDRLTLSKSLDTSRTARPDLKSHSKKDEVAFLHPLRVSGFQSSAANQCTEASAVISCRDPFKSLRSFVICRRLVSALRAERLPARRLSSHLSMYSRRWGAGAFFFDTNPCNLITRLE